jgi:hypothetical protein
MSSLLTGKLGKKVEKAVIYASFMPQRYKRIMNYEG